MNGAVMKNFVTAETAVRQRAGRRRRDCSSAKWTRATARSRDYWPRIAVVNNISLDHKIDGRIARAVRRFRRQGARSPCSISTMPRRRCWRAAPRAQCRHLQPDDRTAHYLASRPDAGAGRHRLHRARQRRRGAHQACACPAATMWPMRWPRSAAATRPACRCRRRPRRWSAFRESGGAWKWWARRTASP